MTTLPRPKAVHALFALVLAAVVLILVGPGRLAAWQAGRSGTDLDSWSEIQQTSEDLRRDRLEHKNRARVNNDLVSGLITGSIPFATAAVVYWENNRDSVGFAEHLERMWGAPTQEEAARLNLMRLVRVSMRSDPDRKVAVTDRMIAEYEEAFGPFPLSDGRSLDR
jgi:hypothetical protein